MTQAVKKKISEILGKIVTIAAVVAAVAGVLKLTVKLPYICDQLSHADLSGKSFWEKYKFVISLAC